MRGLLDSNDNNKKNVCFQSSTDYCRYGFFCVETMLEVIYLKKEVSRGREIRFFLSVFYNTNNNNNDNDNRVSQKFCNILVCASLWHIYHVILAVLAMEVSRILVVGILTHCALLHSVCDLKATQMNVQHSILWEFMFYKFKLAHNAMEATKNKEVYLV